MAGLGWLVAAVALLAVAVGAGLVIWARRAWRDSTFDRARREFHLRREGLEAKFFSIAGASGKPRGLDWTGCEFEDDVAYARDRQTGQLAALVGVTISFAATPGGGMEEVEAVSNLRAATAVFLYTKGGWKTEGRAIFNLNPAEAIRHFQSNLVMVAHDTPSRV